MTSDISTSRSKLRTIIAAWPHSAYALIDGAHFADLPGSIASESISSRSLFLDSTDPDVRAAGPWLIPLDQAADVTDKVFALVGAKPAAVFWCCDRGEPVLWRHLRGLNIARIPRWAVMGEEEPTHETIEFDAYDTVSFRHWDPRVLANLLPALDAAQFSRFLGPAAEISFMTPVHSVRRVIKSDDWPRATPGVFKVSSTQITALKSRKIASSYVTVEAFLRSSTPSLSPTLSSSEVEEFVRRSGESGRNLGLKTHHSQCIWAYLMMLSNEEAARLGDVTDFIRYGGIDPDEQVVRLLDLTAEAIRTHSVDRA